MDPEAGKEIDWLIRLVSEVRSSRTELNVPPGARLAVHLRDASAETQARFERLAPAISRMARIDLAEGDASGGAAQVVVDEATFVLPLEGVIDLAAERTRLTKAIEAASKERDSLAGRLNNPSFVERAKPGRIEHVVQLAGLRHRGHAHDHRQLHLVEQLLAQGEFVRHGQLAHGHGVDAACPLGLARAEPDQPTVEPALLWWRARVESRVFHPRQQGGGKPALHHAIAIDLTRSTISRANSR